MNYEYIEIQDTGNTDTFADAAITVHAGNSSGAYVYGYFVNQRCNYSDTCGTCNNQQILQGVGTGNPVPDCGSIPPPPPPPPVYTGYVGNYYPCDGFCESPGDIVVSFAVGYTPSYTKFYRVYYGSAFVAIRFYAQSTDPVDANATDYNLYASCANACNSIPVSCIQYQNFSGISLIANWTDCSGNYHSGELIPDHGGFCAQVDSVTVTSGGPITNTGEACL